MDLKKDNRDEVRMAALCRFCLDVSIEKKGAYISDDRRGVLLVFSNTAKLGIRSFLVNYFRLGNECIGWSRALSIINRERAIQNRRPGNNHLYCWMIATHGIKDISTFTEMRHFLFELSNRLRIPVIAETTSKRALQLYQRYGFGVYDQWDVPNQNLTMWFIVRNPR
ncbi:MAG: hypothetical protein WDO15_06130 [Bacteroidota bacterium]